MQGVGLRKWDDEWRHFFIQKVWQGVGRENRLVVGGHSRTQQRFFQVLWWGAGEQGNFCMSGIHLILRTASVSRCATVCDEHNNVSICQPSRSPCAPTKASMFTDICY